jgi:hypothetical protein
MAAPVQKILDGGSVLTNGQFCVYTVMLSHKKPLDYSIPMGSTLGCPYLKQSR